MTATGRAERTVRNALTDLGALATRPGQTATKRWTLPLAALAP